MICLKDEGCFLSVWNLRTMNTCWCNISFCFNIILNFNQGISDMIILIFSECVPIYAFNYPGL